MNKIKEGRKGKGRKFCECRRDDRITISGINYVRNEIVPLIILVTAKRE